MKFSGRIFSFILSALCVQGVMISGNNDMIYAQGNNKYIVGYLPDWSYGYYKDMDFTDLTHINIAFCNPDTSGNLSCYIPDAEMKKIVDTAHENGVKVLASLGGAGGSGNYPALVRDEKTRNDFCEKIIDFCEKYNLDGIDLDIEGEVETKAITPAQLVDYVSSNAVLQSDIGDYVGDGVITIEQNGQTVGSFSVNQSTNQTIQLTGGTTPGNLVTTNTDQDITGAKYFSNNKLLVTDGNEFGTVAIFDNTIYATTDGGQATGGVLLGGSGNKSLSDGTKIKFYDDNAEAYKLADIMHSGNLVGGSNVTITKSSGKYIISSTGGGGGSTYTAGDNIDISSTNF